MILKQDLIPIQDDRENVKRLRLATERGSFDATFAGLNQAMSNRWT